MTKSRTICIWLTGLVCVSTMSLRAQDSTREASINSRSGTFKHAFSIFGGATIPLGDFSDPNVGAAKTGFTAGGQFVLNSGFLLSASYTSNPSNLIGTGGTGSSSNWKSVLLLSGFRIGRTTEQGPAFFFAPLIGVAMISSPSIEYSITETFPTLVTTQKYSTASVSTSALAYGVMVGLDAKHLTLGARYIASNPTFNFSTQYSTDTGVQSTREGSFRWKASLLQIFLGILF